MKEKKSFTPSIKFKAKRIKARKKRKQTLVREITGKPVIKLMEMVIIYPRGNGNNKRVKVRARIDTGASMSSIDEELAEKIGYREVVELDKEYGRMVEVPRMNLKYRTKKDEEEMRRLESIPGVKRTVVIRSSHGFTRRVVVPIVFRIKGVTIKTEASIISRAHLKHPLIIGRKDLRKFIIDPRTKTIKDKFR